MTRKERQRRTGTTTTKSSTMRSDGAHKRRNSTASRALSKATSTRRKAATSRAATAVARRRAQQDAADFPIVAIGASAGGLEAFKKFFARMPASSGMAFVLIPHLDPKHKSLMAELVRKHTTMPVLEAAQRMAIRPNHVYVIPPNKYLAIRHRRLALSRPPASHGAYTAIDFALRSLAEDQRENAIGIVMSGTGSHGAAGLREIKVAGGMVVVQDPDTAQYDQMPRAVLATGMVVDHVLAPENMPDALLAYARRALRTKPGESEVADAGTLERLSVILTLLHVRTNYDFRHYRKNMILRRIQRRMALSGTDNLQKYMERLHQDANELMSLRRDLSIRVTAFFREPEAFNVLAARVVPNLLLRARAEAPLRIWVPACSTGEEAYSIAVLFMEKFRDDRKEAHIQIFASDIDEESLKIARCGVYPDTIASAVSPKRLQSFFVRTDLRHYQVIKPLRDIVIFASQNLISDAPFSKLDLISCRNALIYLEPAIQAKVISLLHFALKEGGYLLLGPTESIGPATDLFEPISKKHRLYRRIGPVRRDLLSMPIAASGRRRLLVERPEPIRQPLAGDKELMEKLLLDEFSPAAVLVTHKYEILSVHGQVVNYLDIPPGKLTRNLMAMARETLRAPIRKACHKAVREGRTVHDMNARVRRNGRYLPCRISVRPVTKTAEADGLLLIVFNDRDPTLSPAARVGAARSSASRAMRELEGELRATREDLQRTIAELERSIDDLKTSNEEVLSMNEELQSANEELESSKEELHSLNEELSVVNNQLEEKVIDLDAANDDLSTFMTASDLAVVFLDPELRIRRFTAPAARLLNLLAGDVGRPLLQLASTFTDDGLVEDARHVITTVTPIEREVRSGENRWYLRRILPYRTAKRPLGVAVTFIDVTQRMEAQAQSRRFAAVLRDSSDAITVVDLDGRITAWNRGAEILYGYTEAEALKLKIADLATEESREQALDLIERTARGEVLPAFETLRRASDGRVIDVWTTVTLLRDASGKPESLAMNERDITARRRAEEHVRTLNAQLEKRVVERTRELQDSEHQMRAILDASADAIVTIDTTGVIVTFNRAAARLFGYSADEAIGRNVGMLMPPNERAQHDGYLTRYRKTRERHVIDRPREVSACRKDNTIVPIRLSVTEVDDLGLFVGCIRDRTAARALRAEVLSIATLEQQRIGQELHDSTQQELTGLGLLAENLNEILNRHASKADADLAGRLASGIALANQHVRSIARGLLPMPIEADALPAALSELARSTQDNYSLSCRFDCPEPVTVGNATTATHLYRIAQEAVGNAVKHAKADTISIRLANSNGDLVLEVVDNGIGIIPQRLPHHGAGLRLMEHRCAVIGGRFSVKEREGGGTVIACAIPRLGLGIT